MTTNRAAWPVNPGAYVRSAVAVAPTGFVAYLASTAATPEAVAAAALAVAADIGAGLTSERWRTAVSWAGTVLAALVLALGTYEGAQALSVGTLLQLDQQDLLAVVALAAKSVLVTFLPNADPVYPATAHDDGDPGDVAAPEPLAPDHDHIDVESVTSVMLALPAELVAADAEAKAAAPPPVPAQAPAPTAEHRGGVLAGILGRRSADAAGHAPEGRHEA